MSKRPSTFFLVALSILALGFLGFWFGAPRVTFKEETEMKAAICRLRGGVPLEKGCGIANCTYTCAIANDDAGKPCTSTDQCDGRCIGKSTYIQRTAPRDKCVATVDPNFGREVQCLESFTGTCATYDTLKNCESVIVLFGGGTYEQVNGDCTM